MKVSEICRSNQFPYYEKCTCGKQHKVLTQQDDRPEYETYIYFLCDCGEYVEFRLPVN